TFQVHCSYTSHHAGSCYIHERNRTTPCQNSGDRIFFKATPMAIRSILRGIQDICTGILENTCGRKHEIPSEPASIAGAFSTDGKCIAHHRYVKILRLYAFQGAFEELPRIDY